MRNDPAPAVLCLSAPEVARLVRRRGLDAVISGIAARIEADLARWPAFDKRARVATHSADGVIELMPISDATHYAFKYVNGHPKNPRVGLPTVMAFGVLVEVATGAPRLLAEMTLTTAIRTAAMSALAAQRLARPGSQRLALIGNGAQAEFQAIALRALTGVRELRLYDLDAAVTAKLVRNLAGAGFELQRCASVADAVRGADIVTTLTANRARAAIVTPEMVEPGMHLNAVGGDCPGKTELHPQVLAGASVFVEYEPQTRVEGELQQLPAEFPVTEFWRVVAGEHPGRRSPADVTVFDSVGFALEDFSALCWLHDAARADGVGQPIELIPAIADPRDLYALLRDEAAPG